MNEEILDVSLSDWLLKFMRYAIHLSRTQK